MAWLDGNNGVEDIPKEQQQHGQKALAARLFLTKSPSVIVNTQAVSVSVCPRRKCHTGFHNVAGELLVQGGCRRHVGLTLTKPVDEGLDFHDKVVRRHFGFGWPNAQPSLIDLL